MLLLKTGNDITKQDVLNDLREYGSGGRYYYRGRSSSEFFGSTDIFSENNLFCLINGFDVNEIFYHRPEFMTSKFFSCKFTGSWFGSLFVYLYLLFLSKELSRKVRKRKVIVLFSIF